MPGRSLPGVSYPPLSALWAARTCWRLLPYGQLEIFRVRAQTLIQTDHGIDHRLVKLRPGVLILPASNADCFTYPARSPSFKYVPVQRLAKLPLYLLLVCLELIKYLHISFAGMGVMVDIEFHPGIVATKFVTAPPPLVGGAVTVNSLPVDTLPP